MTPSQESKLREILKDLYRTGHADGQSLDAPLSFNAAYEAIASISDLFPPVQKVLKTLAQYGRENDLDKVDIIARQALNDGVK